MDKRRRFGKQAVLDRDDYSCQYCGKDTTGVDHIVPYSYKVDNSIENLVACCRRCNSLASNMLFSDFIDKKDYILSRIATRGGVVYTPSNKPVEQYWKKKEIKEKKPWVIKCLKCEKEIETICGCQKYCNSDCQQEHFKEKQKENSRKYNPVETICKFCDKKFMSHRNGKMFCSEECGKKHWKKMNNVTELRKIIDKLTTECFNLKVKLGIEKEWEE